MTHISLPYQRFCQSGVPYITLIKFYAAVQTGTTLSILQQLVCRLYKENRDSILFSTSSSGLPGPKLPLLLVEEWKTNLMSLSILFHFLCAQHVSDTNISIIRSLRLYWWITISVVLFSVRCVLEVLVRLVSAKRTPPKTSRTKTSNTKRTENKTTDVVIPVHGTATYRCDDTRDCVIQFCLLTMSPCARNM